MEAAGREYSPPRLAWVVVSPSVTRQFVAEVPPAFGYSRAQLVGDGAIEAFKPLLLFLRHVDRHVDRRQRRCATDGNNLRARRSGCRSGRCWRRGRRGDERHVERSDVSGGRDARGCGGLGNGCRRRCLRTRTLTQRMLPSRRRNCRPTRPGPRELEAGAGGAASVAGAVAGATTVLVAGLQQLQSRRTSTSTSCPIPDRQ